MTDIVLPWARTGARHAARAPWRQEDETTRYLCAAAHLDQEFADQAIRETLVEPLRAAPPMPGVNVGAVLREAVAARTRRRIRDAILLVCLLGVLYTGGYLFMLWLLYAIAWSYLSPGTPRASAPPCCASGAGWSSSRWCAGSGAGR